MSPGISFICVLIDMLTNTLQELEQAAETALPYEEAMNLS